MASRTRPASCIVRWALLSTMMVWSVCSCGVDQAQAQPMYGGGPGYGGGPMAPSPGSLPWDTRQQYYEQLPADRGGLYNETVSPMDRFLFQVAEQSWIKVDYLHWNIGKLDDDLIGERVLDQPRPDLGYTPIDRNTGTPPTNDIGNSLNGYTPRLGQIDLDNMPGMRLTYGLETNYGSLEANVFWIFQNTRSFEAGPYVYFGPNINGIPSAPNTTPLLDLDGVTSIPLLFNGQITNRALTFDTAYGVNYDSSLFGTEINFVMDDKRAINGFHFRMLYGFRYMNFDETMTQIGVNSEIGANQDVNGNDITYLRTSTIASEAKNQIFGPQVGARIELVEDRLTLGAQPVFAFAFNRLDARVSTTNLYTADDPTTPDTNEATLPTTFAESQNSFAPVFSLALYAKIRLLEQMHLYVGYDLLYMDNISRPADNIVYNDGNDLIPDINVRTIHSSMLNQGLSVGTVFEF